MALPAEDDGEVPPGCPPLPARPQFPPAAVALSPAFPPELSGEQGGALHTTWAFLHTFGGMLGLRQCTVSALS